ncbi:MAG: hypothetical protein Sylvanvirus16_11 [Sylvanvirus sp.]|uniref:Uncharacterized protein n=1 Tax=Sylvanvirus sp. TaxID=2487774 RepID=A0A3G5AIG3_9VIRU|nr:MAG: hypothetical protein Sylvanvirus16_11 [Sylvanvirus sp.]
MNSLTPKGKVIRLNIESAIIQNLFLDNIQSAIQVGSINSTVELHCHCGRIQLSPTILTAGQTEKFTLENDFISSPNSWMLISSSIPGIQVSIGSVCYPLEACISIMNVSSRQIEFTNDAWINFFVQ